MNTLVIVLIAAVCLIAGYTFYGSWLAKKWGIDPKAKTPAVAKMTVRITSLPMDGPYSPISFLQSQVQALSPVPFRPLSLDGFPSFMDPDRRHLLWRCY